MSIAPRVGLSATSIHFNIEGDGPESELLLAPQVGITLNAQFGNLALQPSVLFSQKGGKYVEKVDNTNTGNGKTYRYKQENKVLLQLSYLDVPVSLVYSTSGEKGGFQIFGGPYIGVGIGGKYEVEISREASVDQEVVYSFTNSEKADIKFTNKGSNSSNDFELRRIDWGFNAGVGYKSGPFQAQIGYGLGLGNLVPKYDNSDSNDKLHNRGVHFSVAYFFGAK